MSPATAEAGPPIVCPVTHRTWPGAKRIELRTCRRCSGLIDTRHEAWSTGPTHATCPERPRVETTLGADAPRPKVSTGPPPTPPDDVHAARLEELCPQQEAEV